ncbi:MAG: hypothetical protein NWF03_07250 [Candidatus Bathyarchaeota archaeon]|nr:hypothetical protein [Candidatus Bathyarchaeota archaeon]
MSTEQEESYEQEGEEEEEEQEEETRFLNAEDVTVIATQFLKRLGNRQGIRPIKASLEDEEYYIVEFDLTKKTATVHVDATTEQIKEYELKEKEPEPPAEFPVPLTPRNIMILAGTAIGSIVISALLGIQSIISGLL